MWIPKLTDSAQPKYIALANAIAEAIESGELKVGDRLPPQRQLAWKLGVNPSTTMQAYREAARRHLVSGEVGRGTYVLDGSKEASLFSLKAQQNVPSLVDLSTNVPVMDDQNTDIGTTLSALIQSGMAATTQNYLSADMMAYSHAILSQWLQIRGMSVLPHNIKLCAGAQQGILAALLSLCQAGEPVLVEAFTAPGIKAAAKALHLPLHGIALDEQGIIADDLDRAIRATGAKVLVLMPILQNPTAITMTKERQQQIAKIVLKHNIVVIEDDIYGALTEVSPLSCLLPNHSLLVSSFSKTVAAGLRIGYIVGHEILLKQIDAEAQQTTWAVSPLNLMIITHWITENIATERLNRQRLAVTKRWRLACKILGAYMPYQNHASPHIWVTTPCPSTLIVAACRAQGVHVVPADMFTVKKSRSHAIRISLAAARTSTELKVALEKIASVLAKH